MINIKTEFKIGIASALTVNLSGQQPVKHPNIIYIMSDDHAYQAISAYGSPLKNYAPTPNIDKIAINGMRFNRYLVHIYLTPLRDQHRKI
jgi:Sulfatase